MTKRQKSGGNGRRGWKKLVAKYHGCWVSTLVLSSLGFSQKTITCRKKGMFILIHQHFSVKHRHYETFILFLHGSWWVRWIAIKVWPATWKDFHPGYRWKCKRFDIASYLYVEANWSGDFCWFTMSTLFSKFQKQRQKWGGSMYIYILYIHIECVLGNCQDTYICTYKHTWGFPKMVAFPQQPSGVSPTKNLINTWGGDWGETHHLRKHPHIHKHISCHQLVEGILLGGVSSWQRIGRIEKALYGPVGEGG